MSNTTDGGLALPKYTLARIGFSASTRVALQHLLWKSLFPTATGLHPLVDSICQGQPSGSSNQEQAILFADLSASSAVLLLDISTCVPGNVNLHGFEKTRDLFPNLSFWPHNVKLFVSDVNDVPAETLKGKYDAVHIRAMVGSVNGNDPSPILRHVHMLLKDDGVLQWDELDVSKLKTTLVSADMSNDGRPAPRFYPTPCLDTLADLFRHLRQVQWITNLSQHFASAGFSVLFDQEMSLDLWKQYNWMHIWCLMMDEFVELMTIQGQLETAALVREIVKGAYEETKQSALYEQKIRVVVGRKSSAVKRQRSPSVTPSAAAGPNLKRR